MDTIEILKNHKKKIEKKYNVKRIGIFGSYAKGKQTKSSDIDIIVEFTNPTFDNFMDLIFYLEDLYGKEIDLVTLKGLSPYMVPFVEEEVIWC